MSQNEKHYEVLRMLETVYTIVTDLIIEKSNLAEENIRLGKHFDNVMNDCFKKTISKNSEPAD